MGTINKHSIPIEKTSIGERLVLDDSSLGGEVIADIIFPATEKDFKYSKASAPELLLKISYGTTSVSLLGNSSAKVQKFLATRDMSNPDVVIVANSTPPTKITYKNLVFSKAKTKTSNKKEPDGFNVRDTGVVKITSDGVDVKIGKTI